MIAREKTLPHDDPATLRVNAETMMRQIRDPSGYLEFYRSVYKCSIRKQAQALDEGWLCARDLLANALEEHSRLRRRMEQAESPKAEAEANLATSAALSEADAETIRVQAEEVNKALERMFDEPTDLSRRVHALEEARALVEALEEEDGVLTAATTAGEQTTVTKEYCQEMLRKIIDLVDKRKGITMNISKMSEELADSEESAGR